MNENYIIGVEEQKTGRRYKLHLEGVQDQIQYSSLPVPSIETYNKVYQYTGATDDNFTQGHFYVCRGGGGSYYWDPVDTEDDEPIQYREMPIPSEALLGKVYQYIGNTTPIFTLGHFYICIVSNGQYFWLPTDTEDDEVIQYTTLPPASAEVLGKVYQYIGQSNETYTLGHWYICVNTSGFYSWEPVDTEDDEPIQYTVMPPASVALVSKVYQYIGPTSEDYTQGHFYICVNDNGTYKWEPLDTEDDELFQYTELPIPSEAYEGKVYQYIGPDTVQYTSGSFYKCTLIDGTYKWLLLESERYSATATVNVGGISAGDEVTGSIREVLDKLVAPNRLPEIQLSINPSELEYKSGETVSIEMVTTVTKRSTDISKIEFLVNDIVVNEIIDRPEGGTFRYTVTGINATSILKVKAYDFNNSTSKSITVEFKVPNYYKAVDNNIVDNISGFESTLGDEIEVSADNKYIAIVSPIELQSIKDQNGIENIDSFTKANLNNLYVYVTETKVTCNNFKYIFK